MSKAVSGYAYWTSQAWKQLIESVPTSYTVWTDNSTTPATYRAECNVAGGTDYDGIDASTVIQATLASNRAIWLKDTFPLNTPLVLNGLEGLKLLGLGTGAWTSTKNTCLTNNAGLTTMIDVDDCKFLEMRGIGLEGDNTATHNGLDLTNTQYSIFDNMLLERLDKSIIIDGNSWCNTFKNIVDPNSLSYSIYSDGAILNRTHVCDSSLRRVRLHSGFSQNFSNTYFSSSGQSAGEELFVSIHYSTGAMVGCTFDLNNLTLDGTRGLYLYRCHGYSVGGGTVFSLGAGGYTGTQLHLCSVSDCDGVTIEGCDFSSTAGSANVRGLSIDTASTNIQHGGNNFYQMTDLNVYDGAAFKTFTDDDLTPSVYGANMWATATGNAGAIDLSFLDDGVNGKTVTILSSNPANASTLKDSATMHLSGDWVDGADKSITLIYNGVDGHWYELSRI